MKKILLLLLVFVTYSITFAQIPNSGLIAYYPMGIPYSNVSPLTSHLDASGNGYHLAVSGGFGHGQGRTFTTGEAAEFNASNSDLRKFNYNGNQAAFQQTGNFTISAWVRLGAPYVNEYQTIVQVGANDIFLRFRYDGSQYFIQGGHRTGVSSFAVNSVVVAGANYLNTWRLITLRKSGGASIEILEGNNLLATISNANPVVYSTGDKDFKVGNSTDANTCLKGRIQDVFYYNRAISTVELGQLACSVAPPVNTTANLNPYQNICAGTSVQLEAQASPNTNPIKWYTVPVGGTLFHTGSALNLGPVNSSVTYYIDATASNGCVSYARVPIAVTVTGVAPTPPVDVTQSFNLTKCGLSTTNLTVTASGTVNWYNQPTGGTSLGTGFAFTTPVLPNAPGPGQTTTVTYYASNTTGCGTSARTPINITVNYQYSAQNTTPAANLNICSGTSTTLTGTSNAPNVEWYLNQPPFTTVSTATSYTTPVLTADASYSFRAIDPSSNQCSFAVTIPVSVSPQPVTPTNTTPANNLTICGGQTTTLAVSGSGTLEWFNVPTGGTVLGTGTSFTTPVLVNSTTPGVATTVTYYVQSTTGCGSSARVPIAITVKYQYTINNTTPTANLQVCQGSTTTLSITTNAPNIEWAENSGGINGPVLGTTATFTTPPIATGTSIFNAQVLGDPALTCTDGVNIFVTGVAAPAAPFDVTGSSVFCFGNALQLDVIGSGTINWFNVPTGGTSLGTGGTFTTPVLYSNATYYAQATDGNCVSARTAIPLSFLTSAPTNTTPTSALTICSGSSTTLTATGSGTLSWFDSPTGGTSLGNGTSFNTGAQTANKTFYVQRISSGCGSARVPITVTVTAAPTAGTLSGTQNVCSGATTTFSSTITGGTWSSSNNSFATVNSTTGVVTGVSAGTATITYTNAGAVGCPNATATRTVTVSTPTSAGTLSGNQNICVGLTTTFNSTVTGGTWSSSNNAFATVNATTGVVTGVSAGTATISYTVTGTGGCADATTTRVVTVTAPLNAGTLSGTQAICAGSTSNFSSTVSGGTWSSSNTAFATVNATTGVVTGVGAGTATITYTIPANGGCSAATATRTVTVTATPNAGTLSGVQAICLPGTTTFTTTGSGGAWSSSNNSIATVNSNGVVTGVAVGTATITYTVAGTGGCANATATRTVEVFSTLTAGTLSGTQAICSGSTTTFSSTVSGGTWSSSNNAIATVNANGLVTGLSAGTATIAYTIIGVGACPSVLASRTVTVTAAPNAGTLSGAQAICLPGTTTFSTTGSGGTWSSSNNSIATVNPNGVVSGVSVGTATITYTVAGTGGCANATATRTVTVENATTPAIISGDNSVCLGVLGSTLTLSSTATNGTWSVEWPGFANIDQNGEVSGIVAGTVNIVYTIPGNGTCAAVSSYYPITINSPSPSTTLNETICFGETFVLNGISYPNQGTFGQTFPNSNGCDSTINLNLTILPEYTYSSSVQLCVGESYDFFGQNLTSDGTYTEVLSSVSGCDSTVTLNLSFVSEITNSFSLSICEGESYTFGSQTLTLADVYTETFTSQGGCDSTVTLTLTVLNLPSGIVVTQNNATLSVNDDYDSYFWFNTADPFTVVGTSATFTVTQNGSYYVAVYNADGCSALSSTYNVVINGIRNVDLLTLSIYPNPANESITIENLPLGSQIKLVDIAGKIIYQSVVNNSIEKIDLQSIASGIYFINVLENGTLKGTSKLVVSK